MVAAAGDGAQVAELTQRASRNGTYLALRVTLRVETPERVLDVYDVLKAMDSVLTAM